MIGEVTVIGAGAIGGFVGARLAAAGRRVTLVDVDADHVEAIRRDGLRVRGAVQLDVRLPARLPHEIGGSLETVLLCVKARHTEEALSAIAPRLSPTGCVVSLQNGLEEHRIRKIVGDWRTVGAFLSFGGHYAGPGEIVYGGDGSFRVGELDGSTTDRVQELSVLLADAHPATVTDRIFAFLWGKTALEAFYFASAIADADVDELLESTLGLGPLGGVVAEVARVAHADGVVCESIDGFAPEAFRLADEAGICASWDAQRRYWQRHVERRTGIWRDLARRGRATEVDQIMGPVLAAAAARRVEAPGLRRLVELVHTSERQGRPLGADALRTLPGAT